MTPAPMRPYVSHVPLCPMRPCVPYAQVYPVSSTAMGGTHDEALLATGHFSFKAGPGGTGKPHLNLIYNNKSQPGHE